MDKSRPARWLVAGPPFVFMVAFFVLPAGIMVLASFRFPGEHGGLAAEGITLETYRFFFSDVIYIEIFVKSFWIAGLTTAICVRMAYPLAMLITRVPKRLRDVMILLVVLPFASIFLIRVYSGMIILGPQSGFQSPRQRGARDNPELANRVDIAALLLAAFLKDKEERIRDAAKNDDLKTARQLVNGGSHGLDRFTDAFRIGEKLIGNS